MKFKRSRVAFTFVDLLIVLLLIAMLSAATLAAVARSHEIDNRVACAKNLRAIGQALQLYSLDNKGMYPRTRFDPEAGKWTAYSGWEAANPFRDDKQVKSPAVNDLTTP